MRIEKMYKQNINVSRSKHFDCINIDFQVHMNAAILRYFSRFVFLDPCNTAKSATISAPGTLYLLLFYPALHIF